MESETGPIVVTPQLMQAVFQDGVDRAVFLGEVAEL